MLAKSEVVTERRSRNQIPKPPYRRTQRARRVCRRRISLRPSACSCSMDWIGLKICPTHMHARKQHFDPLWHRGHELRTQRPQRRQGVWLRELLLCALCVPKQYSRKCNVVAKLSPVSTALVRPEKTPASRAVNSL